jgi:APA family basic amino acid/polyamine antiporter
VGVRPAAITQNVFTILKLAALAALIAAGLVLAVPVLPTVEPSTHPSAGLGAALLPILFTYGGWQQTNFIAEEIVEPERNLPRALVIGVAIVIAVYVLTNIAYLRVLGVDGLAASTAPASDTMQAVLGVVGGKVIAAGIAISTFGFLNLVILVTPRVLQAMAADGVFFRRLAILHPTHQTPTAAILALALFAGVLTLTGTFRQLVDYVTFGDWLFFALVVATVYVYRARDHGVRPGFGVPGYPVTPAMFVLVSLYIVINAVASSPRNSAISAGLIVLGVPAFLYWRSRP